MSTLSTLEYTFKHYNRFRHDVQEGSWKVDSCTCLHQMRVGLCKSESHCDFLHLCCKLAGAKCNLLFLFWKRQFQETRGNSQLFLTLVVDVLFFLQKPPSLLSKNHHGIVLRNQAPVFELNDSENWLWRLMPCITCACMQRLLIYENKIEHIIKR